MSYTINKNEKFNEFDVYLSTIMTLKNDIQMFRSNVDARKAKGYYHE